MKNYLFYLMFMFIFCNFASADNHVKTYLDTYVTDFGPLSAELDFIKNPQTKIVSEQQCKNLFNIDNVDKLTRKNGYDTALRSGKSYKEYFAGQILTALGIPTARTCLYYKDGYLTDKHRLAKDISYEDIKELEFSSILNLFAPTRFSKILVGESDLMNADSFYFLAPNSPYYSLFAYDFENAGSFSEDQFKEELKKINEQLRKVRLPLRAAYYLNTFEV